MAQRLVDDAGRPSPGLLMLYAAVDGPVAPANGVSGRDILRALEGRFLRRPGVERWDLKEAESPMARDPEGVHAAFEALGMLAPVTAPPGRFAYIVVLGAGLGAVQKRLGYLVDLANAGVMCDRLVFHSGRRYLTAREADALASLYGDEGRAAQTETDMLLLLWRRWPAVPPSLAAAPCEVVDAPEVSDASGVLRRPTTETAARAWASGECTVAVTGGGPAPRAASTPRAAPAPGTVLLVSSQPFVAYQRAVVANVLGARGSPGIVVTAVGPGLGGASDGVALYSAAAPGRLGVLEGLDNVCRWLYEELRHAPG